MSPLPPDLREAKKRGAEVERRVAALGGYQAASAALDAAGLPLRWESLRRYVRGERVAPDDVLAALDRLALDRPRWVIGRDEQGRRWIIHLHRPRFAARVSGGALAQIDWIDGKPEARRHGMLIADAEAALSQP